jgi:hypothetical protein
MNPTESISTMGHQVRPTPSKSPPKAKPPPKPRVQKEKPPKQKPPPKPRVRKTPKPIKEDNYTEFILRRRYNSFILDRRETMSIIKETGLPIRLQNPPEDITENIIKFIIQNKEKDLTCKWAKAIGKPGDLYSGLYALPPEAKAFTSDGPCSFGPNKKFGVLYFLDMRKIDKDNFIVWKVPVTNDTPVWKSLKMSKNQTNEDQCNEGRRPHISWDSIYSQLHHIAIKIYDGTFEDIFTAPLGVSI